jgi:hypothetical protein
MAQLNHGHRVYPAADGSARPRLEGIDAPELHHPLPHYAMSGGTLIALAADQIVMAPRPCSDRSIPSWASTRRPRS